jgi:hypothetical protein
MDKGIKALEAKFNQKAYNLATTINEIVKKSLEDEDVYDTDLETRNFVNELVREAARIAEDRRNNKR